MRTTRAASVLFGLALITACSTPQLEQNAVSPPAVNAPPSQAEAKTKEKDKLDRQEVGQLAGKANVDAMSHAVIAAPIAAMKMASPPLMHQQAIPPASTAKYAPIDDNAIKAVAEHPVSTFSIDVDTGSYANIRRFIARGQWPVADAVRVEEMVNYFPYDYPYQANGQPFSVHTEIAPSPWHADRHLLKIGVKAQDVNAARLPPANLVFLVDVSGSMSPEDRLPLVRSALKLLVQQMRPQDRISLVVYASGTGVVLPPTAGSEKQKISNAIDNLVAGGSTAGEAGIKLAYRMAHEGFIAGGINRVLLATDGDFNVGTSDINSLKELVANERKRGISLSTLGVGDNNYNDQLMEQVADVGDGNYSYLDSLQEAHKVLVDEFTSTLATVAKDVKIQFEFNPKAVQEYRLIGYENRMLKREDFNNDKVDAGEIGAGKTVTALYEITLAGKPGALEPLRYGKAAKPATPATELGFLRLRYKAPDGDKSKLMETAIHLRNAKATLAAASNDFRFAAAVAGFAQQLRGGKYTGEWAMADAIALARASRGEDRFGHRSEFLRLAELAKTLNPARKISAATPAIAH